MFNFMNKKPTAQTESPEQKAALDTAVDIVLLGYQVGDSSIAMMVTGLERSGNQLTLDLRLPPESDLKPFRKSLVSYCSRMAFKPFI